MSFDWLRFMTNLPQFMQSITNFLLIHQGLVPNLFENLRNVNEQRGTYYSKQFNKHFITEYVSLVHGLRLFMMHCVLKGSFWY